MFTYLGDDDDTDDDEDGGSDVDAGEACDNKCGANEKCVDGVCTCPEGADCAGELLLNLYGKEIYNFMVIKCKLIKVSYQWYVDSTLRW